MTKKRIEECVDGDILALGVFEAIDARMPNQGENTVNVRLRGGMHYTETKNALVEIYGKGA